MKGALLVFPSALSFTPLSTIDHEILRTGRDGALCARWRRYVHP